MCPPILGRTRVRARTRSPATRRGVGRKDGTILEHERLDVYRLPLDFLAFANQVLETLPRGRAHLCDQLTRADRRAALCCERVAQVV